MAFTTYTFAESEYLEPSSEGFSTSMAESTPSTSTTTSQDKSPLTTTFTPPRSCFDIHTLLPDESPETEIQLLMGPLSDASECFPPGFTRGTTYSPGVCPKGYADVQSVERPAHGSTEIFAHCCPS